MSPQFKSRQLTFIKRNDITFIADGGFEGSILVSEVGLRSEFQITVILQDRFLNLKFIMKSVKN